MSDGTKPIFNGAIDGLVRQPGYPKLSGKEGDESIIDVFISKNDESIIVPDYGDYLYDPPAFFKQFTTHRLSGRELEYDDSNETITWKLTYSLPPWEDSAPAASEVKEAYILQNQQHEAPIETHPKYVYAWNHELWTSSTSGLPEWYYTSKDGVIASGEDEEWEWTLPGDKPKGSGFFKAAGAYKPGVEAYRTGIPTVQHVLKSTAKRRLQARTATDYTMEAPEETFGVAAGQWLKCGSSIQKNGRYWELTETYQALSVVDEDLYGNGTGRPKNPHGDE